MRVRDLPHSKFQTLHIWMLNLCIAISNGLLVSSWGSFTLDHIILYHFWKTTSMEGSDG
jgi:hypothetical protein